MGRRLSDWLLTYPVFLSPAYPYDVALLCGATGDNALLDERVVANVEEFSRRFSYPRLVAARPEDFFTFAGAPRPVARCVRSRRHPAARSSRPTARAAPRPGPRAARRGSARAPPRWTPRRPRDSTRCRHAELAASRPSVAPPRGRSPPVAPPRDGDRRSDGRTTRRSQPRARPGGRCRP